MKVKDFWLISFIIVTLSSISIGIWTAQANWNVGDNCMFPAPGPGIIAGIVCGIGSFLFGLVLSPAISLLLTCCVQWLQTRSIRKNAMQMEEHTEVAQDELIQELQTRRRSRNRKRYLWELSKQFGRYTFAGALMVGGVLLLLTVIVALNLSGGVSGFDLMDWLTPSAFAGTGVCMVWGSIRMFRGEETIPAVELWTTHDARLLPLRETLLRGSDLSLTQQQGELLRPGWEAAKIHSEELLRVPEEAQEKPGLN